MKGARSGGVSRGRTIRSGTDSGSTGFGCKPGGCSISGPIRPESARAAVTPKVARLASGVAGEGIIVRPEHGRAAPRNLSDSVRRTFSLTARRRASGRGPGPPIATSPVAHARAWTVADRRRLALVPAQRKMSAVILSYQASASSRFFMRTSRLSPTLLMKESALSNFSSPGS